MKRTLFALGLVLAAATTSACNNSPAPLAAEDRMLSRIEPLITRDLTPELARTRIGTPDEEPGSGLIIFVYRVDGGRTVWLSFPGYRPIVSARVHEPGGAVRDLAIR
jgi:hypothetical protein